MSKEIENEQEIDETEENRKRWAQIETEGPTHGDVIKSRSGVEYRFEGRDRK